MGRKKLDVESRRKSITMRLPKKIVDFLKENESAQSRLVETAIIETYIEPVKRFMTPEEARQKALQIMQRKRGRPKKV